MDRVFRLFISHSSPTEDGVERLRQLARQLESKHPRLLVMFDKEQIVAGDAWRTRIAMMLHSSHAGAVLIDQTAVSSPWVLAESIVLSMRSLAQPDFRFIPIYVGCRKDVKNALATHETTRAIGAASWQMVNLANAHHAAAAEPALICREIDAVLAHCSGPSDLSLAERLADEIEPRLLRSVGGRALQELASKLEHATRYYQENPGFRAALSLVNVMLSERRLMSVGNAIRSIRSLPVPSDNEILEVLAPLVIPEISAALLARQNSLDLPSRHSSLAVSTSHEQIVKLYLRRGHLPRAMPGMLFIRNSHGSFMGVLSEMHAHLRATYPAEMIDDLPREALDELAGRRIHYLVFPAPISAATLDQIQTDFPHLVVIQCHSHATPGASGVLEVAGGMTDKEELAVLMDYLAAQNFDITPRGPYA